MPHGSAALGSCEEILDRMVARQDRRNFVQKAMATPGQESSETKLPAFYSYVPVGGGMEYHDLQTIAQADHRSDRPAVRP